MSRRILKALVYVLVAAQMLAAPVVDALAQATLPAAAETHCADMPSASDEGDPCPCCPEGTAGMTCLSTCLATPGAVSTAVTVAPPLIYASPVGETRGDLVTLADPPLKPPPIA